MDVSQHGGNLSPMTYDDCAMSGVQDEDRDERMPYHHVDTASSRSSISSLPASVTPSAMASPPDAITPTKNSPQYDQRQGRSTPEPERRKWRDSPFRHPSSVRNMQMRDEDDEITLGYRRRSQASRNVSRMSIRSSGSASPSKTRKSRESPLPTKEGKMKKEFPLVLLHCSLLPPTVLTRGSISDAAVLQAVLPEEYRRRWERLTETITASLEIQSRGILIPHPKADYDLLEERLLESLELTRPRLRSGHYFGGENGSGSDSSDSDAETTTQGIACQDCGKRIVPDKITDRKWEVRVYAANGLMRAGAWSAAWNEMEKVDVEVSVCVPEEVKREIEERCSRLGIEAHLEAEQAHKQEGKEAEMRRREVYGSSGPDPQAKVDGLFDPGHLGHESQHQETRPGDFERGKAKPEMELAWLLFNSVKVLAQDRRNIAIALLGLAVAFYASRTTPAAVHRLDRHVMQAPGMIATVQSIPRCSADTIAPVSPAPEPTPASMNLAPEASVVPLEPSPPMSSTDGLVEVSGSLSNQEQREASHGANSHFQAPLQVVETESDQETAVESSLESGLGCQPER